MRMPSPPADASAGGTPAEALAQRERRLEALLSHLAPVVVAYSGGVDSAYLACVAARALGPGALAVTADSPSYPERHRRMALDTAASFSLNHEFVRTGELDRPEYRANDADRCYHCKHELFSTLTALAADRGFRTVVDGCNADDRGDYRPGRRAAREFGVRSPLDEIGMTKTEIRELARRAGLPIWDEPASACLSSRIPYHSEVTDEKLRTIERAEDALRDLGFRVCRVRHHDTLARLEIGRDEMARALDPAVRDEISRALRALGYRYVTIDLDGYRTGSLNEALRLHPIDE